MAYLVGSEGPTILLFGLGPTGADFVPLQEVFRKLSRDCKSVRLEEQEFVVPLGGIQAEARSVGRARPRLRRTTRKKLQLEWTLSPDDWDERTEFIEGLIDGHGHGHGHQYLTDRASDDATLVVSYGEYTDELLYRSSP